MLTGEMSRYTTFKFCLDPTLNEQQVLARHAGASRFAFNQCLRMVKTALTQRKTDPDAVVAWTGFDLINAFNTWKKTGWIGIDRGLSAFVVAATSTGEEVARVPDAPKGLVAGMKRQQRLAKSLSRKQKGSHNRRDAAAMLGRHHHHVANVRRHFLHQVSNSLVKTHDRLVIENLNVSGMLANRRLARAISDAGWAEFGRLLKYKQTRRGGQLVVAGRWYPSSRRCAACGVIHGDLTLADRMFTCGCGHSADRDTNAATNLAQWAQVHHHASPDPRIAKHEGRATNARRREGADQHPSCAGETSPVEAGTDVHTAPAA
jgi:putative transposase